MVTDPEIELKKIIGFEWDRYNFDKNWRKQKVSADEIEEVFNSYPKFFRYDKRHSKTEIRFYVFGYTKFRRLLTIVFTVRNKRIRVISARDISRGKESRWFQSKLKKVQN